MRASELSLCNSHLLGQQHLSRRLKQSEQTDKECWLGAGDCSGTSGADNTLLCYIHHTIVRYWIFMS